MGSDDLKDMPLLPDPVGGMPVPGPDDPSVQRLLNEVLATEYAPTATKADPRVDAAAPRQRSLIGLAAAAAVTLVIAVVGSQLLPVGGPTPSAEASVIAAVDATMSLTSGRFEVERHSEAAGNTLDSLATGEFSGPDYQFWQSNEGGILTSPGAFTPDVMEVQRVGGLVAMRLEPMEPHWVRAEEVTSEPFESIGAVLRQVTDSASGYELCPVQTAGADAYCSTTGDPEVAALGELFGTRYIEARADVRIEIDDVSGLISSVIVEATDVIVDTSEMPGLELPPIERMRVSLSLLDLGADIVIDPVAVGPPSGQ